MKALVGALNQEKALVGAFSVIVKTDSVKPMDRFAALHFSLSRSSAQPRLVTAAAVIIRRSKNKTESC